MPMTALDQNEHRDADDPADVGREEPGDTLPTEVALFGTIIGHRLILLHYGLL